MGGGITKKAFGTERYYYYWNQNGSPFSPRTYNVTKGKVYTFMGSYGLGTTQTFNISNSKKLSEYYVPYTSGNVSNASWYQMTFIALSNTITITGGTNVGTLMLS